MWFYLHSNRFIFGPPGGDEHLHVIFRRIGKSTFLDCLGNGVFFLLKNCVSDRETPLLRSRCANAVNYLPILNLTFFPQTASQ